MSLLISIGATLAVFFLLAGGLALGQIFGRPPVKGSCGGLACMKTTKCAGCANRIGEP